VRVLSEKVNGNSCSAANECSYPGAECLSDLCTCPTSTYLEGSSCLDRKLLFETWFSLHQSSNILKTHVWPHYSLTC